MVLQSWTTKQHPQPSKAKFAHIPSNDTKINWQTAASEKSQISSETTTTKPLKNGPLLENKETNEHSRQLNCQISGSAKSRILIFEWFGDRALWRAKESERYAPRTLPGRSQGTTALNHTQQLDNIPNICVKNILFLRRKMQLLLSELDIFQCHRLTYRPHTLFHNLFSTKCVAHEFQVIID